MAYIYFTSYPSSAEVYQFLGQKSNRVLPITLSKPKLDFQLLDFHIQNYKKYPRSESQGTEKHRES